MATPIELRWSPLATSSLRCSRSPASEVDRHVGESLAARGLDDRSTRRCVREAIHCRSIAPQYRETIARFDLEREPASFQREGKRLRIARPWSRACTHERLGDDAAEHVQ